MRRPRSTPEDYKEIAQSVRDGMTPKEAAYVHDVSTWTVRQACRRNGVNLKKGKPRSFTVQEAIEAVEKHGSATKAAEVLGVSRWAVCKRLNDELGRPWVPASGQRAAITYTQEERDKAVGMYIEGALVDDISAETGMAPNTIRAHVKEQGVELRRPKDRRKVSHTEAREMVAKFGTHEAAAEVLGVSQSTVTRTLRLGGDA